jgi:hypothetical protein
LETETPKTPPKPPLTTRLKTLFDKYGTLALVIYFVLFGLVFGGFIVAIKAGVHIHGATSGAGLVGAAYVATRLTQPLRILATLALVPVVAKVRQRRS